jgi:ribosome modulation factor
MRKREDIPPAYYDGRSCRQNHSSKLACPYTAVSVKGGWFLAGWNDMDMELFSEAQEQSAAAAAPDSDQFAA